MASEQILIRVNASVKRRVERQAAKEHRSMSNLVGRILDEALPAADDETDEEDEQAA